MGAIVEMALMPWARRMKDKVNLPVRLVWRDGGTPLDLGHFESPAVTIRVRDASGLPLLIDPSLDTLGRAYVEGLIDVEGSLTEVVAVAHALADHAEPETGLLGRIKRSFAHSRETDAEAIQYHYDVSNAFYREWLGESMVYSCAYFEQGTETLEQAQDRKIDHILGKVQLQPGQRLLDIGCGWGSLVIRAARDFGARCVGITLSKSQLELATERVKQAGLQDRVELRLQDYRDVSDGPFDRVTSVGMFEHVGLNHLAPYFAQIRRLLKPDGWAMNHGITSTDPDDGETRHGAGSFIERYVFPQGELPHIGTVLRTMQQGGLEAFDVENLRRHYARTCGHWSERFEARADALRAMVDEKTWRIWRVYLAGCARAFEHDEIALYQVLCRPAGRSAQELPWSRRWLYAGH
ncbi:class I SAM-dependent methyltransferase [Hydrogenophaga sp. XSHU_21]